MTRGKATRLGDALAGLQARLDKGSGGAYRQAVVSRAWTRIAGPSVVGHTTGAHLRAGELVVYVDSPVWATELSALSEQYRVALNEEIGEEAVRTVRFSVSRRVLQHIEIEEQERQADQEASADKVASIQLTDQERAQVLESAAAIEDAELRETVIRATIADLEWKKGLRAAKSREKPREDL